MEGFSIVLIFVAYVGIRLLLGHHKDQTFRDTQKYKDGIALVEAKQYEQGFDYFDKILEENPKCGVAWAYRGRCNLEKGNLYQALADATKAINIDYKLRECYYIRGVALFQLENYQGATIEFSKTLWHYRDKHPEAYRYRGLCHYHSEDYLKAQIDLEKAVRLQDEDANYYLMKILNRQDVF